MDGSITLTSSSNINDHSSSLCFEYLGIKYVQISIEANKFDEYFFHVNTSDVSIRESFNEIVKKHIKLKKSGNAFSIFSFVAL
jgi:phosphatidylserine/phosphatidylglycerophosphate/cardiolipin synthase-like enzyme